MQRVKYVLVAFLALALLALLALNPGVPAERAAAGESFELRGTFDLKLLLAGGATVTANVITLSIPVDGGDVSGNFHFRVEGPGAITVFPGQIPDLDCTLTVDFSGSVTGNYSAGQLVGTMTANLSYDWSACPPEYMDQTTTGFVINWDGTFDEAVGFAQGRVAKLEFEFSLVVVGTSGPPPATEAAPTEPGPTEEQAGPTPTLTEDEAGPTEPGPTEDEAGPTEPDPTEEQVGPTPTLTNLLFGLDLLAGAGEEIDLTDEQRDQINEGAGRFARFVGVLVGATVGELTPLQRETAALFALAGGLGTLKDPAGKELFPSFTFRSGPGRVMARLAEKALGYDRDSRQLSAEPDLEARVALERFIRLVAAMDQEARMGGGR